MTNKTLTCSRPECAYTARSPLSNATACRGVRETPAEQRLCPHGHGPLVDPQFPPRKVRNA